MARPPKLANASLEALTAEIHRRRRALPKLEARASALREQLAEIEAEIASLGGIAGAGRGGRRGRAGGGRRGRGRRGGNLASDVAKVLGDKPMGPKQIADAIVAAKLRAPAKTLAIQVSQVLSKNKSTFARQGRGQWTRKG